MPDGKPRVLVQIDCDPHPSVFDAIVAVDAGVDHVLRHGGVRPEEVRNLVYGAIFTRGVEDLRQTAIFVGGSDVSAGGRLWFLLSSGSGIAGAADAAAGGLPGWTRGPRSARLSWGRCGCR